jgi:hypothetical protein
MVPNGQVPDPCRITGPARPLEVRGAIATVAEVRGPAEPLTKAALHTWLLLGSGVQRLMGGNAEDGLNRYP